jgi:hypothetical protein
MSNQRTVRKIKNHRREFISPYRGATIVLHYSNLRHCEIFNPQRFTRATTIITINHIVVGFGVATEFRFPLPTDRTHGPTETVVFLKLGWSQFGVISVFHHFTFTMTPSTAVHAAYHL